MKATTQVICYITDCPIPAEDARPLILSDDGATTPEAIEVFAHKDVLDFLVQKRIVQKTDAGFIAFL